MPHTSLRPMHGFTLVELIMVIVLIGIVAVYAAPRMDANLFDARAAAQELAVAIRYTQEQSMNNSGAAPFEIAITGTGYAITQGGAPIPNPLDNSNYTDSGWAGEGVTTNVALSLCFNSRGRPFDAGCATATTTPTAITVTAGGDSVVLTVEALTGYVML